MVGVANVEEREPIVGNVHEIAGRKWRGVASMQVCIVAYTYCVHVLCYASLLCIATTYIYIGAPVRIFSI